jgi:hypothetical protein
MSNTERKEKSDAELSHFCTIDNIEYYDADFSNVHGTWGALSLADKKRFKTDFAKSYKVSRTGDMIRVNGRKDKLDRNHNDANGNKFRYSRIKKNQQRTFSVPKSLGENGNGGKLLLQIYRVTACTFLVNPKDAYSLHVDHIKSQKLFKIRNESDYLANLRFLTYEEHKNKSVNDMNKNNRPTEKFDEQRAKEINKICNEIMELFEGKTWHSKSLSHQEKTEEADRIRIKHMSKYSSVTA